MELALSSAAIVGAVQLATATGLPVPPGLAMLLVAPCVLYMGASKAAASFGGPKASGAQAITQGDAVAMPLIACAALLTLYAAFKYASIETVNALLLVYFTAVGTGCWAGIVLPVVASLGVDPAAPLVTVPALPWGLLPEAVPITRALLLSTLLGTAVPALYAHSRHWAANNLMGVAFCVEGLAVVDLGDFKTGALMLGGLFFYDIAMVFGTKSLMARWGSGGPSVMEVVATRVDGPIKLLFPIHASAAVGRERPYSLLGLGDIIVPGIFLVLLLRFDAAQARARKGAQPPFGSYATPYFNAGFLAYVLGLCATLAGMHWMGTAQPALLYLCPLCLAAPMALALVRGEVVALTSFAPEEKEKEKAPESKKSQ